jgi:hypothetical protein
MHIDAYMRHSKWCCVFSQKLIYGWNDLENMVHTPEYNVLPHHYFVFI